MRKADLDTPALCLDADAFAHNVRVMSQRIAAAGKQWRPHAKCHKSPRVAAAQLAAGAIGVTVAKVSEAEVFANAGVRDILIANLIVGGPKLDRLVALSERADPIVACDHFVQAQALSDRFAAAGRRCRVVIEVNIGMNRVGIRPGADFRDLARGLARLPGINLVGVMGYEGHALRADDPEKAKKIESAMALLVEQRDLLLQDGLPCEIVSAGGTGSYEVGIACPGITEIQAGGGVFADPMYCDTFGCTQLRPALTVLATVVSRPRLERAVVDAGRKSLNPEFEPPRIAGTVSGRPLPDASIAFLSAEHGVLDLGPRSYDLQIGDKLELRPGYSDFTVLLHTEIVVCQGDEVVDRWPVAARGCLH